MHYLFTIVAYLEVAGSFQNVSRFPFGAAPSTSKICASIFGHSNWWLNPVINRPTFFLSSTRPWQENKNECPSYLEFLTLQKLCPSIHSPNLFTQYPRAHNSSDSTPWNPGIQGSCEASSVYTSWQQFIYHKAGTKLLANTSITDTSPVLSRNNCATLPTWCMPTNLKNPHSTQPK